jgi:hypothetical protein
MHLSGRRGKASCLGHGQENFELKEIHGFSRFLLRKQAQLIE